MKNDTLIDFCLPRKARPSYSRLSPPMSPFSKNGDSNGDKTLNFRTRCLHSCLRFSKVETPPETRLFKTPGSRACLMSLMMSLRSTKAATRSATFAQNRNFVARSEEKSDSHSDIRLTGCYKAKCRREYARQRHDPPGFFPLNRSHNII